MPIKKSGDAFLATSKKQYKRGKVWLHASPKYKLHKVGEKGYFQYGQKRYYCEVRAIVTVETGIHVTSYDAEWTRNFTSNAWKGSRWWRFTYLVVVIK